MRASSKASRVPSPSHAGQAPAGLLKEKRRGAISGKLKPQLGQAFFSESWSGSRPAPRSSFTRPAPRRSAVSIDSAMRPRAASRTTTRSTTRSMSWRRVFASTISSERSRSSPSTRTRAKPWRRKSASSFLYSPFRPRTTGAITSTRVPSPRASTWAAIWATLWLAIASPQLGQWGTPARAKSRRR